MSHLDDFAAALADGELDHDARDRALSHLAGCPACRAAVEAQRRLKALIANQPDPAVPPDLAARLLDLARTAAGPNKPDVVRVSVTVRTGPASPAPPARPARRRRSLKTRAATLSAAGLALVATATAVGSGGDGPRVRPPVATFVDEHTATTGRLGPLNDPAGSVVLTSFGR